MLLETETYCKSCFEALHGPGPFQFKPGPVANLYFNSQSTLSGVSSFSNNYVRSTLELDLTPPNDWVTKWVTIKSKAPGESSPTLPLSLKFSIRDSIKPPLCSTLEHYL